MSEGTTNIATQKDVNQECVRSSDIDIDLDKTEWLMILEALRNHDHGELATKISRQLERFI